MLSPAREPTRYADISFADDTQWCTSRYGYLFKTSDGGQTWHTLAPAPEPTRYADISFADDTHWWASRYGYLFKTSDGGQAWRPVGVKPLLGDWNYQPAHVIDSMHAWSQMISTAHSTDSALAMTSDGGVTWTSVDVPRPG